MADTKILTVDDLLTEFREPAPAIPTEDECRVRREMARRKGDAEGVAFWSRRLWRHYVRARYVGAVAYERERARAKR